SAGGQRIFKRAFQLPIMRVVEDVIDHGARPRAFHADAHLQADQLQRIAAAKIHPRKRRPLSIAMPNLRRFQFFSYGGWFFIPVVAAETQATSAEAPADKSVGFGEG